jgi:hypothetical protein
MTQSGLGGAACIKPSRFFVSLGERTEEKEQDLSSDAKAKGCRAPDVGAEAPTPKS